MQATQLKLFAPINESLLEAALELAYEAGRWHGEVDLEERIDRQQYGECLGEVFNSYKTCMPQGLPILEGRRATCFLRSEDWRQGVVKESRGILEKAKLLFIQNS